VTGRSTVDAVGIGLAILLGGTSALQVALLGAMSRQRGSIEAAFVSLLGTITAIGFVLAVQTARGAVPALPRPFDRAAVFAVLGLAAGVLLALGLRGLAPYFAVTGMLAAPYLIAASFLGPRLGIGLFLAAVIAGQLAGGVLLDHIGAFGATPRPLDPARLVGIGVLLLGVALVRGVR
jgi:transporter family-2 protein